MIPAEYSTDPETLRDVVSNPDQLAGWLDEQLRVAAPAHADAERLYRTEIGVAARMLGRLELAKQQLGRALELAMLHGLLEHAVLARVRYAHVLHWQGRFGEATAEVDRCIADAPAAGDKAHFIYQHAGKCAYDAGDWTAALEHFARALRLREPTGDAELIASSLLAWDAAGACATAAAAAAELHRVVPGGHAVVGPHAAPLIAPVRPNVSVLVDSRTLLLAGPMPLSVLRAIHRYHLDRLDGALGELAGGGWLILDGEAVHATDRCRSLLVSVLEIMDRVFTDLWAEPAALLSTVDELVGAGRGTSEGDAFDPLADAGHPGDGSTAGRLFTGLCALRYHRADAHNAAWSSEGLTPDGVRALDSEQGGQGGDLRRRIGAATDRIASRPYRALTPDRRAELLAALRALPV